MTDGKNCSQRHRSILTIASALKLTCTESKRISMRSGSAETINVSASLNAFMSIIMHFFQNELNAFSKIFANRDVIH